MRKWLAGAVIALFAMGAWGQADKAPQGSSVRIAKITPGTSSRLTVGDEVTIRAEVEYVLSGDSGTVTLVIQSGNKPIASKKAVIKGGSGKVELASTFVVPHTWSLQVFTPLTAQGKTITTTVDQRTYRVRPW